MEKLHDIMKPIDERKKFKEYWQKKLWEQRSLEEKVKMKDSESVIERRMQNRKLKMERMLMQSRKPERDILLMSEDTKEFQIQ